jgi:hypothetical protein
MGIYIYQSLHGPYIKVGHYSGQNAYSRVAHRGFYSCVCPTKIKTKVSIDDLELLAWFPSLTKKEERAVKTKWKGDRWFKSEWFPLEKLEEIQQFLEMMEPNQKENCCKQKALETHRRL